VLTHNLAFSYCLERAGHGSGGLSERL